MVYVVKDTHQRVLCHLLAAACPPASTKGIRDSSTLIASLLPRSLGAKLIAQEALGDETIRASVFPFFAVDGPRISKNHGAFGKMVALVCVVFCEHVGEASGEDRTPS